jgi:hypothetical protein
MGERHITVYFTRTLPPGAIAYITRSDHEKAVGRRRTRGVILISSVALVILSILLFQSLVPGMSAWWLAMPFVCFLAGVGLGVSYFLYSDRFYYQGVDSGDRRMPDDRFIAIDQSWYDLFAVKASSMDSSQNPEQTPQEDHDG